MALPLSQNLYFKGHEIKNFNRGVNGKHSYEVSFSYIYVRIENIFKHYIHQHLTAPYLNVYYMYVFNVCDF